MATANITGDSNVISSNSQRTEYGWIKYKVATTDIIHIYREETFLQDYNYVDTTSIPAEQFTKSADRVVDAMTTQLSRKDTDPLVFDAAGSKISGVGTPTRHDDLLTKVAMDNMGTTASLAIPASGGSGDNGKHLCPSAYAPSGTPAVAWASRLGLPSTSGVASTAVLSPVADYSNTPYVEWTEPRWIFSPPNDGLRSVYNYGTGGGVLSETEGEGTTKSATWRQFREMPATPSEATDVNKVIRLKTKTWSPPSSPGIPWGTQGDVGDVSDGSYRYEHPVEPPAGTEATRDLRMIGGEDGTMVFSPRIKTYPDSITGINFNTYGAAGIANRNEAHPSLPFTTTNVLVNDSGNKIMPHMVFMQCKTTAYTVAAAGVPGSIGTEYTAYPVWIPHLDNIDNRDKPNPGPYLLDYSDDGVSNNTLKGSLALANHNNYGHLVNDTHFSDIHYLHFGTNQTCTIQWLVIYTD